MFRAPKTKLCARHYPLSRAFTTNRSINRNQGLFYEINPGKLINLRLVDDIEYHDNKITIRGGGDYYKIAEKTFKTPEEGQRYYEKIRCLLVEAPLEDSDLGEYPRRGMR